MTVPDHRSSETGGISRRERTVLDPIVQMAIRNVEINISAMTAAEVVELAVFPQSLAEWAREIGRREAQVYNLLRGYRPYEELRSLLATRLDVPAFLLADLIRRPRAQPVAKRLPAHAIILRDAGIAPAHAVYHSDRRTGDHPLERQAVVRMRLEAPAMPNSRLISYAIYPQSLANWAKARGVGLGIVLSALHGYRGRGSFLLPDIARRLGVSERTLRDFISSRKRVPFAVLPPADSEILT